MIPGKYDITIVRGGTFQIGITAKSDGSSSKFDQYTSMRMQVRPQWTYAIDEVRPAPLLELTTENGMLSVNSLGDTVIINLTAEETENLSFTEGQYDLEMVIAGTPEVVDKILYGLVTVMGEVTI